MGLEGMDALGRVRSPAAVAHAAAPGPPQNAALPPGSALATPGERDPCWGIPIPPGNRRKGVNQL